MTMAKPHLPKGEQHITDPLEAAKEDGRQGLVVQLQHFSLHDGDGIRTTLFLAGCPLRCRWCANPESWEMTTLQEPGTGKPLRRWMWVEDIVAEVRRQVIFYRASGGGITYSGGEPTVQQAFLRRLAATFSAMGIHQAIETCGHFPWDELVGTLRQMDTIFVDIKTMDAGLHRSLTGCDNRQILSNIRKMRELTSNLVIRIPLIPGVNDGEENLMATAAFVRDQVPDSPVELLPYHPLGQEKYDRLGLESFKYQYRVPSPAEMERAGSILERAGVSLVSYR